MSSGKYRKLNQFRFLLRLPRVPFLHAVLEGQITRIAETSFEDNPTAAMNVVLIALMNSRSPRRSMFLLKLLQDLPEHLNSDPRLVDFLNKYVQGSNTSSKLLSCRVILHRFFAGLEFGEKSERGKENGKNESEKGLNP